jgi:hypothetical protein
LLSKIESIAYLFTENTLRKDSNTTQVSHLFNSIDKCILKFKTFILQYRAVSNDAKAFDTEYSRINILYKALNQLRNIYGDIKQKLAIWSKND